MIAIKNTGFLNACNVCGTTGFAPIVTYDYDSEAAMITLEDDSTFAAGDGLKIVNITITDGHGTFLSKKITVTDTPLVADVSTLDSFLGFTITATVVTNFRMLGDLSAYQIGAISPSTGNLRYLNKSQESNNT